MSLDPTKQDIWFLPLMSNAWHLWKAGNPESVCGLPWNLAANSFDSKPEQPAERACVYCAASQPNAAAEGTVQDTPNVG